MGDYGAVECDLSQYQENGSIVSDNWTDSVKDAIKHASDEIPRVCCIEGAIEQAQVDFIRSHTTGTIVVNVDVEDRAEYLKRHVERELSTLDTNDDGMVSALEIASIETGMTRRHQAEAPYPNHDVSIINSDDLSTTELASRCGTLVKAVSNCDQHTVSTPSSFSAERGI